MCINERIHLFLVALPIGFLPGPGCEHGHVSKGQWDQGDGEESQIVHKPKACFTLPSSGLLGRWNSGWKGEGI